MDLPFKIGLKMDDLLLCDEFPSFSLLWLNESEKSTVNCSNINVENYNCHSNRKKPGKPIDLIILLLSLWENLSDHSHSYLQSAKKN